MAPSYYPSGLAPTSTDPPRILLEKITALLGGGSGGGAPGSPGSPLVWKITTLTLAGNGAFALIPVSTSVRAANVFAAAGNAASSFIGPGPASALIPIIAGTFFTIPSNGNNTFDLNLWYVSGHTNDIFWTVYA